VKVLVVIPTYNERENIANLVPEVLKQREQIDILVVDDNSPDKTAEVVKAMNNPRVHLLLREKKAGLGRAYLAGFEWGLSKNYDMIIEMDADFSHRPVDLNPLIDGCLKADFAIGSRYIKGGGVMNWGLGRRIISKGGGLYSRMILGYPINDWTGGFNAWSKKTLLGIDLKSVESNGYSFQIELKYRASKRKFKGVEVPILFEERRDGQSKMSSKIFFEALLRVWKMRFQ
jgi:dolichol-phosphate mannosyltransferase